MNDHDLDALASDLLDGLLPAERSAAALRDPAVAQRVAEMRAARELVREGPTVDPARREAGLAAALGAAGTLSPGADSADTPAASGAPDEVGARRDQARPAHRRRRQVPGWLTAAAVLLLVVAFGGLVATVGGSDRDDTQTSSDAAAPPTDESAGGAVSGDDSGPDADADSAESSDAPAAGAPTTTAALGAEGNRLTTSPENPPIDLGDVASVDEVAAAVGAEAPLAARSAEEQSNAQAADAAALARFAGCRPTGAEDEPGRTVIPVAVAALDGRPVTAWLVSEDGARTVIVADAGCTVVGQRAIPG
jgi:hypothetical protein